MDDSQPQQPKPDKKERNRKANKVLVPIVGILFLIVIIAVIASAAGGGSSKKAKFSATMPVDQFSVINPATLAVTFHITNTGNAAGSPTCQIEAEDVNYTYSGVDSVQMKPIQPGQTITSVDNLTITKQGAQYVTQGKITCS